ncbi:DJ-1/PfpI family protein [Roseospira goensis]|uniref:Cyclohexyl-isocyanide hydratase n=1 Tax=Roseospira goensis TaxID=391922 RepID=A0A7W6WK98_9PROT|nr:DJ-1/PfpI family protein [Roseospira goensis]MBB4285358.1 cyclohexyl-isocyanide hydratase [Roseospira goensis]
MPLTLGLLVFPDLMQLDMSGPHEVFAHFPDSRVLTVWKDTAPLRSSGGLGLLPDVAFADCPPLDVVCVPGGSGTTALLEDAETLVFLRRQAAGARFVTSVCTGSLVLGAAGLLEGRRAACHWMWRDLLSAFGATPDPARVVVDGPIVSGGGVTAGIDFALTLAAVLFDDETARSIQLAIEYAPAPPFDAGRPETAGAALEQRVRAAAAARRPVREAAAARAAEALRATPRRPHVGG